MSGRPAASFLSMTSSGVEMCGDFKRGVCERGDRCRYSHGDMGTGGSRCPGSSSTAVGVSAILELAGAGQRSNDKLITDSRLGQGVAGQGVGGSALPLASGPPLSVLPPPPSELPALANRASEAQTSAAPIASDVDSERLN